MSAPAYRPLGKTCNKREFATAAEAEEEKRNAQALRAAGQGNGKVERRVYYCTACVAWHVTSQTMRKRSGRRR